MKKEHIYTTRGNTLKELGELIATLTHDHGENATVTEIESDIELRWQDNSDRVEAEWHTGTIGVRITE